MTEKYVLWVDDDQDLLVHSIQGLHEAGIKVKVAKDVKIAASLIATDMENQLGVILDIMMNPTDLLDGRSHRGGFETGFRFLDYLSDEELLAKLRIFVFTNSTPFKSKYTPPGTGSEIKCYRKSRYTSRAFVKLVMQEFEIDV